MKLPPDDFPLPLPPLPGRAERWVSMAIDQPIAARLLGARGSLGPPVFLNKASHVTDSERAN